MASSPGGRQVDPTELIKRLSTRIADLTVENTMLQMGYEDLELENAQLKRQAIVSADNSNEEG